jgi:DNA-binding transcriptional regulator YiaG
MKTADLAERAQAARRLQGPRHAKALRRNAGVTASELAAVVGVSRRALLYWEAGERRPRGGHLVAYVKALEALTE